MKADAFYFLALPPRIGELYTGQNFIWQHY